MKRISKDERLPGPLLRQPGVAMPDFGHTDGQKTSALSNESEIQFRNIRKFSIVSLLVGGFLMILFFILGCKNDESVIEAWSKKKVMVDVGKDIVSYLSQEGQVKAKLTAPLMLRYNADTVYTEFPKTLHVDFYDDSAKIETRLDSKHGKYFENLNKVYLWDSVVVINVQGDTLKSNDLWWDQNKKLFYTDNYAEYRTKDKQIFPGKGLEATQDFTRITFKHPVGTVEVSDKNFTN
jgi:LPS export ABC transporter protein LptC